MMTCLRRTFCSLSFSASAAMKCESALRPLNCPGRRRLSYFVTSPRVTCPKIPVESAAWAATGWRGGEGHTSGTSESHLRRLSSWGESRSEGIGSMYFSTSPSHSFGLPLFFASFCAFFSAALRRFAAPFTHFVFFCTDAQHEQRHGGVREG
jgi:hypothetical protein